MQGTQSSLAILCRCIHHHVLAVILKSLTECFPVANVRLCFKSEEPHQRDNIIRQKRVHFLAKLAAEKGVRVDEERLLQTY